MRSRWLVATGLVGAAALLALAVPAHAGAGAVRATGPLLALSGPAVTFSPTSLTYPAQDVGTTSAARSVTVTNTGDASLFINSAQTRGADPLDFTQVDDGCSGMTLPAGGTCSVSITFSPITTGTRSATFILTDNAANSPQNVPITGTGTGTAPPLALDNQFFTCANGVCDLSAGHNSFVNNFFTTTFRATGGTEPYSFSAAGLPTGLTLRPSGLLLGTPTALGSTAFTVTVTDAAGTAVTGNYTITVNPAPAPSPPGCQTGGTVRESLTGSVFNGQTPTGTATVDMSKFSGCGGYSLMTVQVSKVSVPNGTQLWVTLDFGPVGVITVNNGSGSMPTYNLGQFGVSRDQVRVYSALPDVGTSSEILTGGSFR